MNVVCNANVSTCCLNLFDFMMNLHILCGLHHYWKPDVCRVPKALPSAQYRALGKITICRVPTKKHSANRQHSAEENFAECQPRGTRRTHLCRVPRGQHSANSVTCATHARTRPLQRGRRYFLPSALIRMIRRYHS